MKHLKRLDKVYVRFKVLISIVYKSNRMISLKNRIKDKWIKLWIIISPIYSYLIFKNDIINIFMFFYREKKMKNTNTYNVIKKIIC